jgi:CubicO group peptidase (beta-lactamase class C family)
MMKIPALIQSILVIAVVCQVSAQEKVSLPDSPAGRLVAAYMKAYNSGNAEDVRKFFRSNTSREALNRASAEERTERYHRLHDRLGSLELLRVIEAKGSYCSVLMRAEKGGYFIFEFELEETSPHHLVQLMVDEAEGENQQLSRKLNRAELIASVEAFLDSLVAADEFSGVVLIAKDGEPLFEKACGFADREQKIPNRVDTKFNLGSINKSFTKVAIHQLVARRKISLDDPIKKHIPDYPNKEVAEKVTVKHLLDMTSGIGDFFGPRYQSTPKENLRRIRDYFPLFADKPLEFEPGTAQRYSNGGYIVLGAIIEAASGIDYYAYVRENVFKPAGMDATESYEKDKPVANRALGYTRSGDGSWGSNYGTLPARGSSAGGGYSTAEDLLKYTMALGKGALRHPDAGGGMGIAGGAPGLNAALDWDPRSGYAMIVLSNYDPPAAERVARQIRQWLPR